MAASSPMINIFEECQETKLSHERLCDSLLALYKQMPFSHFAEEFFELCRYSLVSSERSTYRECTIDFIVRFVIHATNQTSTSGTEETTKKRLLIKMFLFCFKYHECADPAPRFRCTQLISKLLRVMDPQSCLPMELFDAIRRVLLQRSQDVKRSVRIQAIYGLARLQNPLDKDCPVVAALLWLARHDKIPEVRHKALVALILTTVTLPYVLERCRDVSKAVRKAAFGILTERSVLRPLSIAQRISIIQDGLTDPSSEVQKAAEGLLRAWFEVADEDPILLLRRLDTEGVPKTSALCLERLLLILGEEALTSMINKWTTGYLDERHLPRQETCSVECVFFWRVVVEHLQQWSEESNSSENTRLSRHQASALLESMVPSVEDYVNFVTQRVNSLLELLCADVDYNENMVEAECVLEHVFEFCDALDLSDEFGRRRLCDALRGWLVSPKVPPRLVGPLLARCFHLNPNVRSCVQMVAESISELLDLAEEACSPAEQSAGSQEMRSQSTEKRGGTTSGHWTNRPSSNTARQKGDDQPKANKRSLHDKVSQLRMQINELNASILKSIDAGDYERAATLRDQCARLEEERTALGQQISGVDSGRSFPTNAHSPLLVSIKDEPDAIEIIDTEEEEEEEDDDQIAVPHLKLIQAQLRYLGRLPSDVILKANKMVLFTLQKSSTLWCLPPSLRSLVYSILLPSIQHQDFVIRKEALLALGLTCTMDLALTKQYLSLFYEAIKFDHKAIAVTAINCLVDIFILFGLRPFLTVAETLDGAQCEITDLILLNTKETSRDANNSNENVHLSLRLLSPLLRFLDVELPLKKEPPKLFSHKLKKQISFNFDTDLCAASAIGLAKLFLFDRIISGQILSLLLLLWIHPFTANNSTLSQTLGVFFTDFAFSRVERQACLAGAILPTLNGILSAPASSPLAEVDPGRLVSLLARLTDTSYLVGATSTASTSGSQSAETESSGAPHSENPHHDDLALKLSRAAIASTNPAQVRIYARMLCQLRLSLNKPTLHRSLLTMANTLFERADRHSRLPLYRFKKNISDCISASGLESSLACLPEGTSADGLNSSGGGHSSDTNSTPSTPSIELVTPSGQMEHWDLERRSLPHAQRHLAFLDRSPHSDWLLYPNDEEDAEEDADVLPFKASVFASPLPVQNIQRPSSSTTCITQSRKQAPNAVAGGPHLALSFCLTPPTASSLPTQPPRNTPQSRLNGTLSDVDE
uniref:Condensin complex subunit 3 n=3 Tax=Schistocephalus solidus TaxID=70667 RepID=A0A0X3NLI9_SCHSO